MVLSVRAWIVVCIIVCSAIPIHSSSLSSATDQRHVQLMSNLPLQGVNGQHNILAILVKFPDHTNSTPPAQVLNKFVVVNNYYNEDSYGAVSFQPTVAPDSSSPWFSLPSNIGYYGADTVASDNQLVSDSLQAAYNAGINFDNYKFAVIIHSGNDEAITHTISDIHSFTIPGYTFQPAPLVSYKISTSVVAETDPPGVYCHEFGHLLGLPDLYDLTQQIDPTSNFIGYWDIMALGEWNPNNGNPLDPQPGTFPAQHSAWSKIRLGIIPPARIAIVNAGDRVSVSLQNLERFTSGNQSIKIPIAVNHDQSLTYYLIEMRAKIGIYDRYLPFAAGYPGSGVLIYKVNESIAPGHGNLRLINAHPGGDLSGAPFGPCNSPCTSNNAFSDPENFVNVIITQTSSTAYNVTVDRTNSPLLLLQVNTPSVGTLVSVDGTNHTSDSSKEIRLTVHYGPHSLYIQENVPMTIGSTTLPIGFVNTFASWNDGNTENPRWIAVSQNTVTGATYRIIIEPSFVTASIATIVLGAITTVIAIRRRKGPVETTPGQ